MSEKCTTEVDCQKQVEYKAANEGRRRVKFIGRGKARCYFCKTKLKPEPKA